MSIFSSRCESKGEAKNIVKKYGDAVVMVFTARAGEIDGLGSGFVIDPDGIIATNFHVVRGADDIFVKFINGKFYNVMSVLAYDATKDIAILRIDSSASPYATVTLGDSSKIEIGEQIVAIGNPQGLENTVSEGVVSQIRRIDEQQSFIQTDAAISQGSSGGPIFNEEGEVIGIVAASIESGQNLNFAIPINQAKDLLINKREIRLSEFITATSDTNNDFAEQNEDLKNSTPSLCQTKIDALDICVTLPPGFKELSNFKDHRYKPSGHPVAYVATNADLVFFVIYKENVGGSIKSIGESYDNYFRQLLGQDSSSAYRNIDGHLIYQSAYAGIGNHIGFLLPEHKDINIASVMELVIKGGNGVIIYFQCPYESYANNIKSIEDIVLSLRFNDSFEQ